MSSKTIIFLLGTFVLIALAESVSDEANEVAEANTLNVALDRVVRDADPKRRNKGGRKRKGGKRGLKKRKNKGTRKNKGKKGGKKNRKNKTRKNKSKNNKNRRNKGQRKSSRATDLECLSAATSYINKRENMVKNFNRQKKRIESFLKKSGNKNDKSSVFTTTADEIIQAGGGNKSDLKCDGSSTSDGAKQLTNLTTFLSACPTTINASCGSDKFPEINNTLLDLCADETTAFAAEVDKCMELQESDPASACECWESELLTNLSAPLSGCKIQPTMEAVKDQYNLCKAAFGECRKYEQDAVPAISACAAGTDALKKSAELLAANSAALGKVETALNNLKSGRKLAKYRRAVPTTCAEVIALVEEIVELAEADTQDPDVATKSEELASASDITCIETELKEVEELKESVSEVKESVDAALEAVQSLLEDLTGSTVSVSSSTGRSSGRRGNIVKQMLMNMH